MPREVAAIRSKRSFETQRSRFNTLRECYQSELKVEGIFKKGVAQLSIDAGRELGPYATAKVHLGIVHKHKDVPAQVQELFIKYSEPGINLINVAVLYRDTDEVEPQNGFSFSEVGCVTAIMRGWMWASLDELPDLAASLDYIATDTESKFNDIHWLSRLMHAAEIEAAR